jgi:thiamine biosynthesis lipoprotein
LAVGAVRAGEPLRIESSIDAMGSTFTLVAYGDNRNKLQAAVDQAFEEIRRLDDLLSNYKPRSEWSRVNREAAGEPVRVSPELFSLLEACLDYSRKTEGAFDITVGPLVRIWGFFKGSGRLPHRAEIRTALAKVGYRNVILDKENLTVRFARPGVELDPGGIGKGYAVDQVADILRNLGIGSALISAGGSSIYGLGAPPNEKGWRVKIRHPRQPAETAAELVLHNSSLSTSGTAEKFFYSGGKLYSHVFDPRTGYPAPGMLSVSVTAPRTLDSEAWTKPLFILGRKWAPAHLPKGFQAFFCEDRTKIACAWLQ